MIAGQQVTDTLRLSRPLGQGAMGSVWIADHLALGTQVAVKFMSPDCARQNEFVERFRREAMAAAQIKSPHVAQVFDHGIMASEGVPYIVMELLEGEDLKSRLKRLGALPPPEVARIVSQVTKALGRAHQLGIVHRDIKPENLFLLDVEGEPFVKVLDFGIAKQVNEGNMGMTSTGSILGTPLYMSPEQLLSSKHVDFRADLWGLTVVAYHALTGQLPFYGETLGALSVRVHQGVFVPPSQVRPGLPAAIDVWMQRALQTDPAARFGSAKELADTLDMAVFGAARRPFASSGEFAGAALPSGADRLSQSNPLTGSQPAVAFGSGPSGPRVAQSGQSAQPGRTFAGMTSTGHEGKRRVAVAGIVGTAIVGIALVGGGAVWVARGRAGVESAASSELSAAPGSGSGGIAVGEAAAAASSAPEAPAVPEAMPAKAAQPEVSAAVAPSAVPLPAAAPRAVASTVTANGRPQTPGPLPNAGASSPAARPAPRVVPKDTIGF